MNFSSDLSWLGMRLVDSICRDSADMLYMTRSKKFSQKNKKDLGMACHIPPLKKAKKQGEMPLPSLGSIPLKNLEFREKIFCFLFKWQPHYWQPVSLAGKASSPFRIMSISYSHLVVTWADTDCSHQHSYLHSKSVCTQAASLQQLTLFT